ncbi:tetratricopeptide repeat protein [Candidatus Omnitrophota bacterium]
MHIDKNKKENSEKFEVEFYEKIIQERPNFVEALKVLAAIYTKSGEYKKGLELDKRLTGLLPSDYIVYYNLACSYSLLGDIDNSLKNIKRAIELGYNDFDYMNKDPDLSNLRVDKKFEGISLKNIDRK